MNKTILLVVSAVLFLGGCVPKQNNKLSIQEQIELNKNSEKSKTHIFKNRTKLEVLEALQKVLNLSDEKNFEVTYLEDKVIIHRTRYLYLLLSIETHKSDIEIEIREENRDIVLTTFATFKTTSGWYEKTININNPSFYDFLYNRIEYVLNINNKENSYKWVTCDEEKERIVSKYGNIEVQNIFPLCFLADDYTPEQYIKKYGK